MTPDEMTAAMKALGTDDMEVRHVKADDLLVETLRALGYGEAMDIYDAWEKWYA